MILARTCWSWKNDLTSPTAHTTESIVCKFARIFDTCCSPTTIHLETIAGKLAICHSVGSKQLCLIFLCVVLEWWEWLFVHLDIVTQGSLLSISDWYSAELTNDSKIGRWQPSCKFALSTLSSSTWFERRGPALQTADRTVLLLSLVCATSLDTS